jgi:hypothetical protein
MPCFYETRIQKSAHTWKIRRPAMNRKLNNSEQPYITNDENIVVICAIRRASGEIAVFWPYNAIMRDR